MSSCFTRLDNLIGIENRQKLNKKCVAVFGLGGVGSFTVEALARSGIGKLVITDSDKIDVTNINRQLYALNSTIGRLKVEVAKERILDINKDIQVETHATFFNSDSLLEYDFSSYDYVVDCIDTVTSKILIITQAKSCYKPVISCLGTGNKLDPTAFKVADISKTHTCPLAKVMRKELSKRQIKDVKTVFSDELPKPNLSEDKKTPSSISFVPPVAGFILASQVIKDLLAN